MPPLSFVPTPSPPQSPGEQIRDAARQIADQAVTGARRGVQAEMNEAIAERQAIQARLEGAQSGSARRDLQSQLIEVEVKIERLQEALDKLGPRTTKTSPGAGQTFSGTQPPFLPPPDNRMRVDPTEIIATSLGILFIAFPLTLALVRFIWKRSSPAPSPALNQEQTRRFDRLEQSVDAIAIEIERISENQRYLTRLLAEPKQSVSVGSGSGGPLA